MCTNGTSPCANPLLICQAFRLFLELKYDDFLYGNATQQVHLNSIMRRANITKKLSVRNLYHSQVLFFYLIWQGQQFNNSNTLRQIFGGAINILLATFQSFNFNGKI